MGFDQNTPDAVMTEYMDCNCRARSRFDPDGNLCTLYTCKSCLEEALRTLRKTLDKDACRMVQLMLLDEDGRLRVGQVGTFYEGQDGGPPEVPF